MKPDVLVELKSLRLHGMAGAWADLVEQGGNAGIESSRWLIEHLLQAEATDRARCGDIKRLAQWPACRTFRALMQHGDVPKPEYPRDGLEEPRLLSSGLEQGEADVGARDRQWDGGKPSARSDVDRTLHALDRCERCEQREAVDDVPRPCALAVDAGEVEAFVGEEEHAEVARQLPLLRLVELDAKPGQQFARSRVTWDRIGFWVERQPSHQLGLACSSVDACGGIRFAVGSATGIRHRMGPSRRLLAAGCRSLGATP